MQSAMAASSKSMTLQSLLALDQTRRLGTKALQMVRVSARKAKVENRRPVHADPKIRPTRIREATRKSCDRNPANVFGRRSLLRSVACLTLSSTSFATAAIGECTMLVMTKTETIDALVRKNLIEYFEKLEKTVQDDNLKNDSIGAKQREKDIIASNEIL
jgi:hypothetical protein